MTTLFKVTLRNGRTTYINPYNILYVRDGADGNNAVIKLVGNEILETEESVTCVVNGISL